MTTTAPQTTTTATTKSATAKRNDLVLAAFRIVVSFLFACHGLQGFGLLGGIDGQGTAVPFGSFPGWWGSVIELVGSVLVLVGVAARPAAVLCSGAMAFAYFVVHQPTALLPMHNMGELAAIYSWAFLLIAVLGPGSFTLSRAFRR
ncbi:putative oxidoreductase [Saccharothrix tamanrassetensis]|uniref:Putative oxidoreductase n=1 Tax=Saccharothrix tamanrassetensis TaxID=1051531 RepID=A0A841CWK5_9PSEU|nr:DoxX family protein [Saccharothrix tamanrassetensis]MBB5960335.1 putative oxidoreductase [Saccharothrix tamanrassetensis]